jgi:hypothetical protein
MANSVYFTPAGDSERTLYIAGTTTDKFYLGEVGWETPEDVIIVDEIPDAYADIDRGAQFKPRLYAASFRLKAVSATALETLRDTWLGYHNPLAGIGVLKRITSGGKTRYLDCRPRSTVWTPLDRRADGYCQVLTQTYFAANPFWRSAVQAASGNFNGATPVNVSCANGGDIPAWPVITITGVVAVPRVTNAAGEYIEINATTANADDTLTIDHRPGSISILYREHGAGAGTNWYGYRTSASTFWKLPVGTANVVLTATSGTCACALAWYLYYRSL